jgi:hypothetical protein
LDGNLLGPAFGAEFPGVFQADFKIHDNFHFAINEIGLADKLIAVPERINVFCGSPDNRKKTLGLLIKFEEINAEMRQEGNPGILEIIKIITVSDHLHGIEIIKLDALLRLKTMNMIGRHHLFPAKIPLLMPPTIGRRKSGVKGKKARGIVLKRLRLVAVGCFAPESAV